MQTTLRSLTAIGLLLAASLRSTPAAAPPDAPSGLISAKGYLNIGGGTTVGDLTANSKFPNSPDVAYYYSYFEWNADPGGDIGTAPNNAYGDNYGAQMAGYFYPPVAGDYVFWVCSDDGSNLYLSTDTDPANKKLIAQEQGWSNPRNWDTANGGALEAKNSSTFTGTQWPTKDSVNGGAKITLQAKKPYYIEALFKEGGGGDNLAVAVQAPDGSIDATLPIPGKYLAPFTISTTPTILAQPKDVAAYVGSTATFNVGLDLPPGMTLTSIKWQKNGTEIASGTDLSVSVPVVAADNNAKIKAIITTSGGTLTSSEATLNAATIANEFTQGVVKFEAYTGIGGGTAITDLTGNDKFTAGTPDDVRLLTAIDSPSGYGDNYGAKVSGFIIPPKSGSYRFFLRSDDASQLWLSNDDKEANAQLIAEETGCCQAFLEPDASVGGWHDNGSGMGQTTLSAIELTGGKKYAFYALMKEGGGGDYVQVAAREASDTTPAGALKPLSGTWIGANAKPSLGDPQITKQPVLPPKMQEGQPWSLSVDGNVTPSGYNYPILVQWQKDGKDIPGANAKTYSIAAVKLTDSGTYRAVLSAPSGNSVNSAELVAQAIPDKDPPTLVSAQKSFASDTKVVVTFSEAVAAASANTAANYKIDNGITVSAAAVASNPHTVELTTSAVPKGSQNHLTVSGVQDLFGNAIAANSSIDIGFQKGIYFVTADPGPLTFAGDIAVNQHLLNRGFDVALARGSDVPDDGTTALGRDLIIESSSLASSTAETTDGVGKFRTLAIPAMDWEASSTDAWGFMAANAAPGTSASQTAINIVDASHPLAAGFPAGPVVVSTAETYSQAQPVGAHVVGTLAGDPSQAVLFYYDKGDKGFGDFVMPARRVFFFFQDNTASVATDNGWKLFDAAVDWLLGVQAPAGKPAFTSVTRSANGLTLAWNSGTLESADDITGTWTPVPNGASPASITFTGTKKFYRVR